MTRRFESLSTALAERLAALRRVDLGEPYLHRHRPPVDRVAAGR
jgi:hypothetical protein